jgi:DNA-binding transcriptional MerR regulator
LTFDLGRTFTVGCVSTTYTIGQIAERSGFSASALRYYEGIGLVEPSTRTGAGYRLYDDESLDRLAFIARAKQLGCSLEEITDLVGIWDGERCGPVQRRFHDLVTEKLADTERQIAELTVLRDELRHAATRLDAPPTDGPCSTQCACMAIDPGRSSDPLHQEGDCAMSADPLPRRGPKLVGLGALACLGCCAGPVLAFLGGLSVAGLLSTAAIGGLGLILAATAAIAYLVVRRRRTLACAVSLSEPVHVGSPTRRRSDSPLEEPPR